MKLKLTIFAILALFLVANVLALNINSVSVSPNIVEPGQRVSLDLTVYNNLKSDYAENVKVSLLLNSIYSATGQLLIPSVPFSPYQSSSSSSVEKIDNDDSESFNFDLVANSDADSGTYKIPVKMDYTVNDKVYSDEGVISITVNAKPELSITSDSPGIIKGAKNEVIIKIINSGLGNAKFLNVQIDSVNNAKIIGAANFYIGDINKDDFDSVKIVLSLNSNSPGIVNIPVTLTYKDSMNKEYTEVQTVSVKAYTQKEAQNLGIVSKSNLGLYIAIIVIVIILFLIYRWFKKRRNNKLKGG